jgi:hypothetical protein
MTYSTYDMTYSTYDMTLLLTFKCSGQKQRKKNKSYKPKHTYIQKNHSAVLSPSEWRHYNSSKCLELLIPGDLNLLILCGLVDRYQWFETTSCLCTYGRQGLSYPKDGGSMFFWNTGTHLLNYMCHTPHDHKLNMQDSRQIYLYNYNNLNHTVFCTYSP